MLSKSVGSFFKSNQGPPPRTSHAAMSAIGATALPEGTSELLELLDEQAPLVGAHACMAHRPPPSCFSADFCVSQVPDELTQYILRKAGQDVADPRM